MYIYIYLFIYLSYFRNTWRSSVGRNLRSLVFSCCIRQMCLPQLEMSRSHRPQTCTVPVTYKPEPQHTLTQEKFLFSLVSNFFQSCCIIISILLFHFSQKCFSLTGQCHLARTNICNLQEAFLLSTQHCYQVANISAIYQRQRLRWSRVACWPLVPKFAGSNPAEAVGFLGAKKSSARLPSEGK